MKTFERLIEKNYPGLNFLLIPDQNHLPGAIIDKDDKIIDHIKNINLFDANKCKTKIIDANIATSDLSYENALNFNSSILGLLKLAVKTTKNYSVSFSFSNVKKIIFDQNGYYENDIKDILMQLKSVDKVKFLRIKRDFIITQSLFVDELIVVVKKNGSVVTQADFITMKGDFSIEGDCTWNAEGKMIIKNTKNVPFGVIDLKIKNNLRR